MAHNHKFILSIGYKFRDIGEAYKGQNYKVTVENMVGNRICRRCQMRVRAVELLNELEWGWSL
jgi:hypothetical protein